MCKFKSAIILKDRVYIADADSHGDMLEQLEIEDTLQNAERLFIRAELSPIDNDPFSDIDTWAYRVDQDILPDWYVSDYDKTRMIEAVKEWAKGHIHIGKENIRIGAGTHYLKDCKDVMCDNSTATLRGNSTATLCDNSTATLWGNSTATLRGNSTATLCDNSTATLWGNSTATLCDNSTAVLPQYSDNKRENVVLCQNSTLKDCKSKTIYQSGDWELVLVDEAEVEK